MDGTAACLATTQKFSETSGT